jgi:hypothetical protein
MKRNGSDKLLSFSLGSEAEVKFFRFEAKKVFFSLFSHLKRNENEKEAKTKRKRSETTNFWKPNKAKIRCINFALIGSEKFEAKRSERKRELAKRMRNGSRFASFCFEAKKNFFAKPAHPTQQPRPTRSHQGQSSGQTDEMTAIMESLLETATGTNSTPKALLDNDGGRDRT